MITQNTPSLDLMEFVEAHIIPRYAGFDRAHSISHVLRVIEHSLQLARQTGADINMAYAIAAYHDLGMSGPRAIHHVTGGKILAADQRLRRWFSAEQLKVMREAVEDHRASASHAPRSIYGKIVAEADRDLEPDTVFRRTVQYGLSHYPEKGREKQWERFLEHMRGKYSQNGYIKLWISNSSNEQHLRHIRSIIEQPTLLRQQFDHFYDQEIAASADDNRSAE